MGTKRFPKFIREKIDSMIVGEATEGRGQHDHLVECARDYLLQNCGSVLRFFEVVAGGYITNRKQSLQREGIICLGANEVAKLPEDMDANDRYAYLQRRSDKSVGDLVGLVKEANRFDDKAKRDAAWQALRDLDSGAADRVGEDLGLSRV